MRSGVDIEGLLTDVNATNVECQPDTNDTDALAEAVCAFANDMPGTGEPGFLIVGADDAGRVVGLDVSDQLLQHLSALRSQGNILPLPALEVFKVTLDGGDVAVVEVQPALLPPVRYKGRVYIRVGPGRAIASEQEERILTERRVSNTLTFDASPAHGSTLDDLSHGLFEDYRRVVVDPEIIKANHRTYPQQLASLRCLDPATSTPTYGGLALFSRTPRRHMPGAYTQYLRFDGTDVSNRPVDQAEIDGDLPTALAFVLARLDAVNPKRLEPVSLAKERIVPLYPDAALREVVSNAYLHRDYSHTAPIRVTVFADRIVVNSPGGLYGNVTVDTLETNSSYRNVVVAEAMKGLDLINRYGYGIQRAQAALAENGNPPLEFTANAGAFVVTIRPQVGS